MTFATLKGHEKIFGQNAWKGYMFGQLEEQEKPSYMSVCTVVLTLCG